MLKLDIQKQLHGAQGTINLALSCTIKQGEFVALSGASGSGKTTLLRIIAGLEDAQGSIVCDGASWLENSHSLPPQKRKIGFVTQDYALFSNMSVEKNLLFVANDTQLCNHLLELMELENLTNKYPHQLSGGQQQRVALARALMRKPTILLLDEPLSALDAAMRTKLQDALEVLHKEFKLTTIMVSHDIQEIKNLASRVLVLEDGTITKDGTPNEVFQPKKATILEQNGSQITVEVDSQILTFTL